MPAAAILPARMASTAVRGPRWPSPPAKTPGTLVISVFGSALMKPRTASTPLPSSRSRSVPWPVARITWSTSRFSSRAVSNFGSNLPALVLDALAELEDGHAFFLDAQRAPAAAQLHALGGGGFDLVRAGRHLAALFQRHQVDALRALAQRRQRHVDGDVAAADDHHARPHAHRLAAAHGAQEVDAAEHEGVVRAFDRQQPRGLRARADEDGVVLLAEVFQPVDPGAGVDRDAQHLDLLEFLLQQLGRQPVGRDAVAQHAAGVFLRLEDLDLVAVGAQVVGGGQPRRAGADDADALAGVGRDLGPRVAAVGQAVLGGLAPSAAG